MPAFKKVTHATAAETFCGSLNRNQRNHLRALLHHETACRDLKHALGIAKATTVTHAARATGLAKIGRTIELFAQAKPSPVNLLPLDREAK